MGLDITAYGKLEPVGKHTNDLWCYEDSHVAAYTYADFPQSFRGVPVLSTVRVKDTDFLDGGCYAITDGTLERHFNAGSYHGYGRWRESLQARFNPGRDPDGPFYELIWFADNEGTIGPDAAADLLADFRGHRAAWVALDPAVVRYDAWLAACELAADHGLIDFH